MFLTANLLAVLPDALEFRSLTRTYANCRSWRWALEMTIEQTIRLQTNQLTPAANDDGIEKLLEERRRLAILEIERPDAELAMAQRSPRPGET
jgi:hypothetical protein